MNRAEPPLRLGAARAIDTRTATQTIQSGILEKLGALREALKASGLPPEEQEKRYREGERRALLALQSAAGGKDFGRFFEEPKATF